MLSSPSLPPASCEWLPWWGRRPGAIQKAPARRLHHARPDALSLVYASVAVPVEIVRVKRWSGSGCLLHDRPGLMAVDGFGGAGSGVSAEADAGTLNAP